MRHRLCYLLAAALALGLAAQASAQKGASDPAARAQGSPPINNTIWTALPLPFPDPVLGNDTLFTASNADATAEPDANPPASCAFNGPQNDGNNAIWWTYEVINPGSTSIGTSGSTFDTILTVLRFREDLTLEEVACNDDIAPGNTQSQVRFTATEPAKYFIRVTGYQGATGTINGWVEGKARGYIVGPPNDFAFTQPGAMLLQPGSARYPDTNIGATQEGPEPLASCVPALEDGRNSVWRSIGAFPAGTVTLDYSASSFDTVVSVYAAISGFPEVACNDDGGDGNTSRVSFEVQPGVDYFVRTVGFGGASGYIEAAMSFVTAAADTPAPALLALHPPSPNPTAGPVHLAADLAAPAAVHVVVLDVLGRRVALLADGPALAGPAAWTWDPEARPAGVYVVRLTATAAGGAVEVQTQRVTVAR